MWWIIGTLLFLAFIILYAVVTFAARAFGSGIYIAGRAKGWPHPKEK